MQFFKIAVLVCHVSFSYNKIYLLFTFLQLDIKPFLNISSAHCEHFTDIIPFSYTGKSKGKSKISWLLHQKTIPYSFDFHKLMSRISDSECTPVRCLLGCVW